MLAPMLALVIVILSWGGKWLFPILSKIIILVGVFEFGEKVNAYIYQMIVLQNPKKHSKSQTKSRQGHAPHRKQLILSVMFLFG